MSDNTSPSTLELATNEELVAELMKRFDTGFLFLRRNEKPGTERRTLMFAGDMYACLGMAEHIRDEIRYHVSLHNEIEIEGELDEIDDEIGD